LSFDAILHKVENNAALMSIEELQNIYHWFEEKIELAYPQLYSQQRGKAVSIYETSWAGVMF